MNWRHFSAFVWLRWRIRLHQLKKAGIVNTVITFIFIAGMIPGALLLFVGAFCAGAFAVPLIPAERLPRVLMYIWDGLALAFLLAWTFGLIVELQRSEALALNQFLHLPVSLSSVFVINYLSSLLSLNLLLFVPAMTGFILGLCVGVHVLMLLLLPLLAAFVFAVTAVSYQFQGWLATLMANPRRRRTIIVTLSMVAILMCQVPNAINMLQPWNRGNLQKHTAEQLAEQAALNQALTTGAIDVAEFQRRQAELNRKHEAQSDVDPVILARFETVAAILNYALPPLWLPLGAGAAAEWNPWPGVLGALGLGLIGTASLWRAYHTTLRLYTGVYTGAVRAPAAPTPEAVRSEGPRGTTLLERRLPGLSEHASAIAVASLRSVLRAPEAKMLLLTPLILVLIFGSMLLSGTFEPPLVARPFMAFGAMAMVLMGMTQLIGNQFGFDRGGFRVFVLSPALRREILLGKNLALAPIALGLGFIMIGILEVLMPMRPDHLLLVLIQAIAMYLLYCLLANTVSILAPMPVSANSLRPVKPGGLQLLIHLGLAMLFPLVMLPVLVPLGVDVLFDWFDWLPWLPAGLLLMAVECGLIVLLYRVVLSWQGKLLHRREQKILESVAAKAE